MNREDVRRKFESIHNVSEYVRVSDKHPLELYIGKNEQGYPTLRYNGAFQPVKVVGNSMLEIKQVNIYFDCGIEGRGKFRYLTPRECLLFMGFTDNDYESIIKNNPQQRKKSSLFPRDKIIRMAGNSIPVKLLEGFFYQLFKLEKLLKNNGRS